MSVNAEDYRLALIGIIAIALIAIIEVIRLVRNSLIKLITVAAVGILILGPSISCFFKSLGANDDTSLFISSLIWLMIVIAVLISISDKKPKNKSDETLVVEAKENKEKTEIFAKELLEKCKDIDVVGLNINYENKEVKVIVENIVYGEGFLAENREIIEGLIKKYYGLNWRFELEEFECQVFTR